MVRTTPLSQTQCGFDPVIWVPCDGLRSNETVYPILELVLIHNGPRSNRCVISNLECAYPQLHVELWSDIPKTTRQQGVFSVWRIPKNLTASIDPFDTLPGGMPLKSHQLFEYCKYSLPYEPHIELSDSSVT